MELISLKSVQTSREKARVVRKAITATAPTTVWKSFTTLISTRQNSVHRIWSQVALHANTRNIAPSRIMIASFLSSSSRSTQLIWTFTCSFSRQFGVRIARMTTTERCVSMRTTGRTTGGVPQCSLTRARCARAGK